MSKGQSSLLSVTVTGMWFFPNGPIGLAHFHSNPRGLGRGSGQQTAKSPSMATCSLASPDRVLAAGGRGGALEHTRLLLEPGACLG